MRDVPFSESDEDGLRPGVTLQRLDRNGAIEARGDGAAEEIGVVVCGHERSGSGKQIDRPALHQSRTRRLLRAVTADGVVKLIQIAAIQRVLQPERPVLALPGGSHPQHRRRTMSSS